MSSYFKKKFAKLLLYASQTGVLIWLFIQTVYAQQLNTPIEQPTGQSIEQPTGQSIKQSIEQSIEQSNEQPTKQTYLKQPVAPIGQLIDQSGAKPVEQIIIPPPPAVALPETDKLLPARKPLAWRAKAMVMAEEYPFKEKNSVLWVLPVAYNQGQNLLKKAINQAGLEIVAEYKNAGQYLLLMSPTVGKKSNEIIIVSQPVGLLQTLFKLRIYSGWQQADNNKAYAIPVVMKDLLENGRLWQ